ncbi:MAG: hypothetical protein AAGE01_14590 [Pseudomonadota bacterium]
MRRGRIRTGVQASCGDADKTDVLAVGFIGVIHNVERRIGLSEQQHDGHGQRRENPPIYCFLNKHAGIVRAVHEKSSDDRPNLASIISLQQTVIPSVTLTYRRGNKGGPDFGAIRGRLDFA